MAAADRDRALLRRRRARAAARASRCWLTGAFAAVGGYLRYRRVDAALREGRPIGSGSAAHTCVSLADAALPRSSPASYVISRRPADVTRGALRRRRLDLHQGGAGRRRDRRAARRPRATAPRLAPTSSTASTPAGRARVGRIRRRGRRGAGLLLGRRRPADRGGRQRGAGHRRGRRRVALSSGGKVVAVLGRRPRRRRSSTPLARGPPGRGAAGRRHRRRQRRGARAPTPRASPATAGAGRSWSPATSSRSGAVAAMLGRAGTPSSWPTTWCRRSACSRPSRRARAIREMFLAHVIGGKGLSARADFTAMVQGADPRPRADRGRGARAPRSGDDVVVVDIGGATTDVHSVVRLDPEDAGLSREVVASTPVTRTVEGDLGMRWSALSTWEAGVEAGLLGEPTCTRPPYAAPPTRPSCRTPTPSAREDEPTRRGRGHPGAAPARRALAGGGRARTVGSSSAPARTCARSTCSSAPAACCGMRTGRRGRPRSSAPATGVSPEGWQQPEHPRVVVDRDYVLAAVGLLARSGTRSGGGAGP